MEAAERQPAATVSVKAENTRLTVENAELKAKLRMLSNVLSCVVRHAWVPPV